MSRTDQKKNRHRKRELQEAALMILMDEDGAKERQGVRGREGKKRKKKGRENGIKDKKADAKNLQSRLFPT